MDEGPVSLAAFNERKGRHDMNRKSFRVMAQLTTLAATGWLLTATSEIDKCTPQGPIRYEVATNCGPTGIVTVTGGEWCDIRIEGAEHVNLPSSGTVMEIKGEEGSLRRDKWFLSGEQGDPEKEGRLKLSCSVEHTVFTNVLVIECTGCRKTRASQDGGVTTTEICGPEVACSGGLTEQP
jgi:hypothetical protein